MRCSCAAKIPVWYKWVYWGVNPISYAQKAMAINEFGAARWQRTHPNSNTSIGAAVLTARQERPFSSTTLALRVGLLLRLHRTEVLG